ncbi:MAG: DUF1501 domain-containing protein [Planctomycetes bacterium]|nr:DUF1501 domain-containing protein [Planctomycetota bacterium]
MTEKRNRQFCGSHEHALSRRQFLGASAAAGAMGGMGMLAQPALAKQISKNDKRVILLWLAGGPSQLETFDPKPRRPTGGPFFDIPTSVPGVHFSELMPKLAARFGKYMSVIRSLNTKNGSHGSATQTMMRGRRDEPNVKYPDLGSLIAKEFGKPGSRVPESISIYSATEGRNFAKLSPGFLGARYATIKLAEKMELENIRRPKGLSAEDHEARAHLREILGRDFVRGRETNSVNSQNMAFSRVPGLMSSRKLFDVSQEPAKVRARYGPTQFGQQAIIARRLVEAGVPYVRLARAWWDTHAQNFESHLELVTELDHVMSTLLDDLSERGLLEHTLVITMAEFGRTPKINGSVGRDHFARAWSVSLSGCGIKHGAVYGKTDKDGQTVIDGEVGAGELFATIFEALGIPHDKEYHIGSRPIPLVNPGIKPIKAILA